MTSSMFLANFFNDLSVTIIHSFSIVVVSEYFLLLSFLASLSSGNHGSIFWLHISLKCKAACGLHWVGLLILWLVSFPCISQAEELKARAVRCLASSGQSLSAGAGGPMPPVVLRSWWSCAPGGPALRLGAVSDAQTSCVSVSVFTPPSLARVCLCRSNFLLPFSYKGSYHGISSLL